MAGIGGRARATPDATALVGSGGARTFDALDRRQRALVGALRAGGMRRRDRIAILSSNRAEYLEVTTGVLRAGIVPVPVHHLLTPPEIAYLLEDSGARWLFTDRPFEGHPGLERTVTFGDAYERLLHDARPADLADFVAGRPMHYTSGTTGQPKGVWVEPDDRGAAARSEDFRRSWGLRDDDIHLVCSPLSHSAPHRFATRTLEAGGTVVVRDRFDAEDMLASIDLFGVTSAFMVPTHLERIVALGERAVARYDLSSVRLVAHAGAPIRHATKRAAIAWFPFGSIWEFYGATEGRVTRISTPEWLERPGSVGMPENGVAVQILDDDGGPVPPGEVGEIWVEDARAEDFSYWGDESKTRGARRGRAWTVGDLGYVDRDDYLFLAGRKFDTIISGGVNVYPQEVEAALMEHPAVDAALVYGAAHEEWGQEVRALVVPAFGRPFDVDALDAWARERLAGFKRPRRIEVVDDLPRTATGKLKRNAV